MTKYKVDELDGAMLDAAVAKAEGLVLRLHEGRWQANGSRAVPWYSTDWTVGGPLIHYFLEEVSRWPHEAPRVLPDPREWMAYFRHKDGDLHAYSGQTPLIAGMRAVVARKFGDEVELP